MVFSSTTNRNGIIQEIEKKTSLGVGTISGDANLLKDFTANVNNVGHRVWHIIHTATGNWQYDDGNNTDLPQATTDLTSGTAKYALPTEALTIQRIELKDANGLWYKLTPITQQEVSSAVDEFYKTDGQPSAYRLIGRTIELFAGPNYSSTGGLKVYYDRGSVDFATSDTTKTPGFASEYHEIIPYWVACDYLEVNQPTSPSLPKYEAKVKFYLDGIRQLYSGRFMNKKPMIGRRDVRLK